MANYISIKQAGPKWVCAPCPGPEYEALKAAGKLDGYYYSTTKTPAELATAGVFGLYNSAQDAINKVKMADPNAEQVAQPPSMDPGDPV